MKLAEITIDTFEGDMKYPVVSHVFTGKTTEEAQNYVTAHYKSDNFFRECEKGKFEGFVCRNVIRKKSALKWYLVGLAAYVGYRCIK